MKKFSILFLVIAFLGIQVKVTAQKSISYDWGESIFEDAKGLVYDTSGATILKSVSKLEFIYNGKGELEGYQIFHEKVKINNAKALEEYNKLSFSIGSYNEMLAFKARFINKDGKTIELSKSNVKTVEQNGDNPSYKLLAIEGANVGGIVEYYWIKKGFRKLYGNYIVQDKYPQKQVIISISSPINLRFMAKSYNSCPEMEEVVDSVNKKRILMLNTNDVPVLPIEQYSSYRANLQRVEYTFAYNYANDNKRLYSWSEVAKNIYTGTLIQKKEEKALKSIIKGIDISKKMDTETKIKEIEKHVKTNFQLLNEEVQGADISYIPDIVSSKYADELGYVRLLAGLFRHFEIPFELLLTCDKTQRKFDKDFDGFNFLDKYLFYFPAIDKYLDPNSMTNRLGIIEKDFLGNYGLFLKPIQAAGSVDLFMPYVKQIPVNDYVTSFHNTNADIKLDVNEFALDYSVENIFSGYEAMFFQPFFHLAETEAKENLLDQIVMTDKASNKVLNWNVENEKPNNWFEKPLILKAHMKGDKFLGRAGENITFNIGMLIGRQSELYREKERTQPIEYSSAHGYHRELTFEIPEGYEILNPETANMKKELSIDNQVEAFFYSEYKMEGNKLKITSNEVYKRVNYPIEKYSEFVGVINAAADFNKITLILKPKR